MSPPTSDDKTGQRVQLPPDQGNTHPGSGPIKDLPDEAHSEQGAKDDLAPASGPDTPDAPAGSSPSSSSSSPHLSYSSPSSSPLTSSAEDSPIEAYPYFSSSEYDTNSSGEEDFPDGGDGDDTPESAAPEDSKDGNDEGPRGSTYTATILGSECIARPIDTCLGAGWAPGGQGPLPNRGYANEYITVAESPLQGYGVFAAANIEEDTHILLEEPLLRLKGFGRLGAAHARLDDEKRAIYDGLFGYHEHETCPVLQKWSANQFDLTANYGAVFAIASNFNHACRSQRNTEYHWDDRRRVITFTATRDIKKGDEILISYCQYRRALKSVYGFICHCGGCSYQAV